MLFLYALILRTVEPLRLRREDGQTTAEYALVILAAVFIVCSRHLCAANDPDPIRNQDVVSQFELGSEQPIECELEMDSTPYRPLLNHAGALPPGKPQRPA